MHKSFHEEFTLFFDKPSRVTLHNLLKRHYGETNNLDFKVQWPSDAKLARHILGLANSGGGCLVIGVEEREDKVLINVGLEDMKDRTIIQNKLQQYLPPQLDYDPLSFSFEGSVYGVLNGKKFQVIMVENRPTHLPFISLNSNGKDIRKNSIYIRRSSSTEEVNYTELQELLNRRLEANYLAQTDFDLARELFDLKTLYYHLSNEEFIQRFEYDSYDPYKFEDDDRTDQEKTFDHFIARTIEAKEKRIRNLLGVVDPLKIMENNFDHEADIDATTDASNEIAQ